MYRVRNGLITRKQFQKSMSYDTYCKFMNWLIFYHKLNALDRPYSVKGLEKNIWKEFEESQLYSNLRLSKSEEISCFDLLNK